MKVLIADFEMDFTHMEGVLTHDGEFVYTDGSHFKDWNNLKDVFEKYDYIPIYGRKEIGSHKKANKTFLGFGHDFAFNEDNHTVKWKGLLFEKITNLTDLENPLDQEYEVSIGFPDLTPNDMYQTLETIDHIAISLNNLELGRCRTAGGHACYAKIVKQDFMNKHQNLILDFIRSSSSEGKPRKIITKKRDDTMTDEEKDKKITEDAEAAKEKTKAAPDNIGKTDDPKLNTASSKASFMLDCKKYGTYDEAVCLKAWNALNKETTAPQKGSNEQNPRTNKNTGGSKDFEDRINKMEEIIVKLGDFIPTLAKVVDASNNKEAEETVQMKKDLLEWGVCKDFIDNNLTDFISTKNFYAGYKGSEHVQKKLKEDFENLSESNTSRLLGQRKEDKTDFEDMMSEAEAFAHNRFYPKLKAS